MSAGFENLTQLIGPDMEVLTQILTNLYSSKTVAWLILMCLIS